MLPKPKRLENEQLLEAFRLMPCAACGARPSDPDHIKTRGAGGEDIESNILPLCRRHHTQRHTIGWFRFCGLFPKVYRELMAKGWEFKKTELRRVR